MRESGIQTSFSVPADMITDALVHINIRQGGVMQGSGAGRAGADVVVTGEYPDSKLPFRA
jgi:hypothetical protein